MRLFSLMFSVVFLLILGCIVRCKGENPQQAPASQAVTAPEPEKEAPTYIAIGDLKEMQRKGTLRVLVPLRGEKLQREGDPDTQEQALVERIAAKLDVKTELIPAEDLDTMFKQLEEGKADMIAASLTITPERAARVAFTRPIRYVKQQVVAKVGTAAWTGSEPLSGKAFVLRAGSVYEETLRAAQKKAKGLTVTAVEADEYALISKVARGEIGYTVVDSDILSDALTFETGVSAVFDLTKHDPIAWALRKNNPELKTALDGLAQESILTAHKERKYSADLDAIKEKRVLRVLTRNSSTTYFIYRGEQLGFEYELMQDFAKSIGVRLEIVIPPDRDALAQYLRDGRGDVVAAGMSVTAERQKEFAFSAPYNKVSELLVVLQNGIRQLEELRGKTVAVRKSSSYWDTLAKIKDKYGFTVNTAPEDKETEEIIDQVGEGAVSATVADSNIVECEQTYNDRIRSIGPLGETIDVGWMVRKDQPKLKEALDAYVKKTYHGTFYNVVVNKYFKNAKNVKAATGLERSDVEGQLSPFDDTMRKYGKMYEFDWRLMTAQMFQESRFDVNAKSWVGALGLMQVMPRTAQELHIDKITQPDNGIHAGVKLMARYTKIFAEPNILEKDRIRFALASYNCGPGHVADARRIAADLKLNPDKWFQNVETAMLLLSKPQWSRKARYGFCRCEEPVKYVSEIQARYDSYSKLVALE